MRHRSINAGRQDAIINTVGNRTGSGGLNPGDGLRVTLETPLNKTETRPKKYQSRPAHGTDGGAIPAQDKFVNDGFAFRFFYGVYLTNSASPKCKKSGLAASSANLRGSPPSSASKVMLIISRGCGSFSSPYILP